MTAKLSTAASQVPKLSTIESWFAGLDWLWTSVGLIAFILIVLGIWLLIRSRRAKTPGPRAVKPKPNTARVALAWLDSVIGAVRYLSTRRGWRYQTPWVLLIGEPGAGKSSLAASVQDGHREAMLLREQRLPVEGTQWHFYSDGVLIDPEGALPAAEPDSDDGKRWQRILDAIDSRRPERPIDAVVLSISATTLLNADQATRRQLAENCYHQLWQLQKQFEFMLPLHIIITRCDTLPGYGAFWSTQDSARRQEIWGWSNPSLFDHEDVPDLIRNLFALASTTLRQQQVEIAAGRDDIQDADRFFLFPQHFSGLAPAMAEMLDVLLKPSTYLAGYYLRGIYFTGSMAAEQAPVKGVCDKVDFVEHLFTRKVFQEQRLAKPIRHSIWSRNQLIRRIQVGTVASFIVLCGLLILGSLSLHQQVGQLEDTLHAVDKVSKLEPPKGKCLDHKSVFQVLESMGKIRTNFHYLAIPASYIDSRVLEDSSLWISQRALHDIVMSSMACELAHKVDGMRNEPIGNRDVLMTTTSVNARKQQLNDFLSRALALEDAVDAFNDLALPGGKSDTPRQVQEFEDLLRFVYKRPIPNSLKRSDSIYREALVKVHYTKPIKLDAEFKSVVSDTITRLSDDYLDELLQRVSFGATLIENLQHQRGPVPEQIDAFQDWLDWMRRNWLASEPSNDPCAEAEDRLEQQVKPLYQKHGYGIELREAVNQFGREQCLAKALAALRSINFAPYGALFTPLGDGFELNKEVLPELAGIAALQKLPMMRTTPRQRFVCQPALTGWRTEGLGQAEHFLNDYKAFSQAQKLDPERSAPLYDRLLRRQLEALLDDALTTAQQIPSADRKQEYSAEAQLATRSTDFGRALDTLERLREQIQQIGYSAGSTQLNKCVHDFASDMLLRVDNLTEQSRLYEPLPTNPATEDGVPTLYLLGDSTAIKDYLGRQRDRVNVLAGYATPFVNYLSRSPAVVDSGVRPAAASPAWWQGTLNEIKRYRDAVPDSAQIELEDYFKKTLGQLDYDNCSQRLDETDKTNDSNDLFSQRRRALAAQSRWRCEDWREADAYERYRSVANRFNRELAERYPFSDSSAQDADLTVVRNFFRDFDNERKNLNQALTGLKHERWTSIHAFIKQLDDIAAFLRPVLSEADGTAPLRLTVGFRALPRAERGAEQLISWRLSAGDNHLVYPGNTKQLDWAFNDTMTLELGWATQSVWRPRIDTQQTDLRTDDVFASYGGNGNWSLLRLIANHRPQTQAAIDPLDASRRFLEFRVPMVDASTPPRTSEAKVYLAIGFNAVDPKTQTAQRIVLPADWPRTAPLHW